jgi:hypothetical protein
MSEQKSAFGQSDIVRLSDEDAAIELLERAVTGLWEVVNELTRFRRTTRQNYRVTIFGSARLKAGTPAYEGVKKLAAELTEMGCEIISGGGPGLAQAANEGAHLIEKAKHRSVGIRVELPFEQEINPFVGQAYEHRTFFSRLHDFMIISDAFVVGSRWHRNSVGVIARVATAPSAETLQHPSHCCRENVGRAHRMGAALDAPQR